MGVLSKPNAIAGREAAELKAPVPSASVHSRESHFFRAPVPTGIPRLRTRLQAWSGRLSVWYTRFYVEKFLLKKHLERLYLVMGGHIFFQTLSAAAQLDLFTLLSKHRRLTGAQIAEHLGLKEQPARILLLGCASLGLLRKKGENYSNSPLAERMLTRNSPGNILAIIEWQHRINYKAMHSFYEALQTNHNVGLSEFSGTETTLYERLAHHPDLEQTFQDAMSAISVQANGFLARFVDFSRVSYLVDVGGGDGTNIMAIAKKYSHLQAAVFDSSSVCRIAHKNIQRAGLQDRLKAIEGDCFNSAFPQDADCLLFAHFFTIWSEERNRRLLEKCYRALPPGGSVIIFNMMQRDDGTGPLSAAMGSPYFLTLATGEGMLYAWNEYETWMREAGFRTVKRQVLPRDHGVIIGIK